MNYDLYEICTIFDKSLPQSKKKQLNTNKCTVKKKKKKKRLIENKPDMMKQVNGQGFD